MFASKLGKLRGSHQQVLEICQPYDQPEVRQSAREAVQQVPLANEDNVDPPKEPTLKKDRPSNGSQPLTDEEVINWLETNVGSIRGQSKNNPLEKVQIETGQLGTMDSSHDLTEKLDFDVLDGKELADCAYPFRRKETERKERNLSRNPSWNARDGKRRKGSPAYADQHEDLGFV